MFVAPWLSPSKLPIDDEVFGGLKHSQAQRLRGLEREDELLRSLVADLALANQQLKDHAGKDA